MVTSRDAQSASFKGLGTSNVVVIVSGVFPGSFGPKIGGSQKGGFQKGGFGGCSPGTKTGTTFAKTTLLETALLSPNDPLWC